MALMVVKRSSAAKRRCPVLARGAAAFTNAATRTWLRRRPARDSGALS
jgi:hypothetical protein